MVENLKYAKKQSSKVKAVQQYDLQGRLIAEWDSISLASKQLGIPVGNIVRNIKSTIVRKYRFKYK